MNNSKPILEVNNLVKKFGDFTAVAGISFDVSEGEIVGFLGPNGAGKSTTINCLLGIIEPDEGKIEIFGKDLKKKRSEIMEEANYCSAEYNLPWSTTVFESLLVYARLYQIKNVRARIAELMDLFDITELKNKQVRSLSFGQRARANLCRSLLNKPRLLLLDEPMASMDPDVVDKGIKLLLKIQKENKMSILYTSHNMWEIEQVANRIIFINHGKIIAQGTPLELTRQEISLEAKEPDLREVFIQLSRRAPELKEGNDEL
jgi:ABC-2 type transport system ATP-binding protein